MGDGWEGMFWLYGLNKYCIVLIIIALPWLDKISECGDGEYIIVLHSPLGPAELLIIIYLYSSFSHYAVIYGTQRSSGLSDW